MDEIKEKWYNKEDEGEEQTKYSFKEYNIVSSPNDFNIETIFNFIESSVIIPGFQRNYVWDIKRASKLIESIIIGLPIPQIFLYEESKNKFSVIDGQQRLMTIYYFKEQRFPKKEYRVKIGKIFDKEGKIPDNILNDDEYFENFNLNLPESSIPEKKNPLNEVNYSTLNESLQRTFDLRTIRVIIIKQYSPPDDDSSMYEIFSRLNTGGMNLQPQEIRLSLYQSKFYELLSKLNEDQRWRKLIGIEEEDIHLKDIEIILRAFAILIEGYNHYKPYMIGFLNIFSKKMKDTATDEDLKYYEELFNKFLESCEELPEKPFHSNRKFNISEFDAIFVAMCEQAFQQKNTNIPQINQEKLNLLKNNPDFKTASFAGTTSKANVRKRIDIAKNILLS